MGAPAQGNSILIGMALEPESGIPDTTSELDFYRAILPASIGFNFGSSPGGEINFSGFSESGVPNAITGAMNFGVRMSTRSLLRVLMAIMRDVTKSEPSAGVFQYVCLYDRLIAEQSFSAIFGLPPVDKMRIDGIKFAGVQFAIGNNNPIAARIAQRGMRFSRLGAAVPNGSNTGTWEGLPVTWGPLADKTLPYLHLEVTALSPLRFKVRQTSSATPPTMSGSTVITQLYDSETGRAVPVLLQNDDGTDIGICDENWDPLLGVFPGLASAHADIDVGDRFLLSSTWNLPTVSEYLGGPRFTSAHQTNRIRKVGDATWTETRTLNAQLALEAELSDDSGSGARYPGEIDRTGVFMPTLQLASRHRSMFMQDAYERHYPVEVQTHFAGRQLAPGYRESIKFDWEGCEVKNVTRPPQNDQAIVETAQLQGNTNDAGGPPLAVTVITDEDVAVPA